MKIFRNLKLQYKMLILAIIPVLIMGIVAILISNTVVKNKLLDDAKQKLKATSNAVLAAYDQNAGDYFVNATGDVWKGAYNVSLSTPFIDDPARCISDRCLEEVSTEIPLEIERKLDMKLTDEDRVNDLDESSYLTGMDLDVDQLVYLEVLMSWPLKVLCKEDCKGLCPHCGADRNVTECDCESRQIDPRFAALRALLDNDKGN